jgi:hypothetical protein
MFRGWSAALRSSLTVSVIVLTSTFAHGAIIGFNTPAGATTGGQPVSAKATFTTSANQVSILLENLQANPTSIVQCLSGLQFTISSGQNAGALSASSGAERVIAVDGTYADAAGTTSTGWSLSTVASSLKLNLLGTPTAPDHTIIGPPNGANLYTGNGSIVNGAHSPFIGLNATFVINVPGVTAQSTITSTTFQFNTAGGNTVPGVPEPTAAGVIGLAAIGALARRSRAI